MNSNVSQDEATKGSATANTVKNQITWQTAGIRDGLHLVRSVTIESGDFGAAHSLPIAHAFNAENARLIAAAPNLLESLTWIFGEIEKGNLVRDISKDADNGFAIRMMQFISGLGKAQAAIAKATLA